MADEAAGDVVRSQRPQRTMRPSTPTGRERPPQMSDDSGQRAITERFGYVDTAYLDRLA